MYTGGRNNKRKNQSGALVYVAVFVLLVLLSNADGELLALIIGIAVLAALAYLAFRLGKKYLGGRQKQGFAPRAGRSNPGRQSFRPRTYNPQEIRDQDNVRRLRQLDSFLENGLIDKKEYAVLRAKYERYMRENENG